MMVSVKVSIRPCMIVLAFINNRNDLVNSLFFFYPHIVKLDLPEYLAALKISSPAQQDPLCGM